MQTKTKIEKATARELMQPKVVQLDADLSVERAVEILDENGITGAPVVSDGRVVGMLSARDVARAEHVREGRLQGEPNEYELADPDSEEPWDDEETGILSRAGYSPDVSGGTSVTDWMTPTYASVEPAADLATVCRVMADERVHRVLVVDGGRLVGLVAASDVVRWLARNL